MLVNKYFLIMNPNAHSKKAGQSCEKIISLLKKMKVDFGYRYTQRAGDAIVFAKDAAKQRAQAVVAVGGDGTICEVINGLFAENAKTTKPKLGVLHVGTSPDFNKNHGIPIGIEDAIKALLQGKTKLIDIGKITYFSGPYGKEESTAYFASNVNVGLGPLVAKKANSRYRRYLGDVLGTLSATLISLIGFKTMSLSINADGKKEDFTRLINLTVGKDPYLASGMRVFNKILADDARMYVLSIQKKSWIALLSSIPKLYLGNFLEYAGAKITYARKIDIGCSLEYPLVEFDGDVKGYLPACIEVLPEALEVIVA